jgi:glutamine synthetase
MFKGVIAEYIWIDADNEIRSKTKILDPKHHVGDDATDLDGIFPEWNYDGSSTGQATGTKSDVILKPCYYRMDPFRRKINDGYEAFLVLCDTYNMDGTPHLTNKRVLCKEYKELTKDQKPLFGIEQEYIIYKNGENVPYNWINQGKPSQIQDGSGKYYCGVGGDKAFGRKIAEKHMEYCLYAELQYCGMNAEVTPSQWEYQLGPLSPLKISDQLWISRYILNKLTEEYDARIVYHPKPLFDFNGSGGHTNFSTKEMREEGGITKIIEACEKLVLTHDEHIKNYGNPETNKIRLSGGFETAKYDNCTYGISDRGASIRIPLNVDKHGHGYLEDRRPPSDLDPYIVTSQILKTVCL